ncbi:MAG: diguanylate cyclase [Gammaproteobacteria bacterium]|nr:diguanylate cyclase [Gammaproteobacteria bacterium]
MTTTSCQTTGERLWRRLSVRHRIILSLVLMVVPLLLLAASGYLLFHRLALDFDATVRQVSDETHHITRLQRLMAQAPLALHDSLHHLHSDEASGAFPELAARIDSAFADAHGTDLTLFGASASLNETATLWREATRLYGRLATLPDPVGDTAHERLRALLEAAEQKLNRLHDTLQRSIETKTKETATTRRQVEWLIIAMTGVALLIVLAIGLPMAHSILAPLKGLEACAAAFTAGHLDQRIDVTADDELARLANSFNQMAEQLQADQQRLEQLANFDGLTGLHNKHNFLEYLRGELERAARYRRDFSLLMVDIDHFKRVNDTYGHLTGDAVLRQVAKTITECARENDVVGRYGGEEIIVLLPETRADGALVFAERLRQQVMEQRTASEGGDEQVQVTVSVGVACCPTDAGDETALIAAADKALYQAKESGRNRVCTAG